MVESANNLPKPQRLDVQAGNIFFGVDVYRKVLGKVMNEFFVAVGVTSSKDEKPSPKLIAPFKFTTKYEKAATTIADIAKSKKIGNINQMTTTLTRVNNSSEEIAKITPIVGENKQKLLRGEGGLQDIFISMDIPDAKPKQNTVGAQGNVEIAFAPDSATGQSVQQAARSGVELEASQINVDIFEPEAAARMLGVG